MSKEILGGYTITDFVRIGDTAFVIGENARKEDRFVVAETRDGVDYIFPCFVAERNQAEDGFLDRAREKLEWRVYSPSGDPDAKGEISQRTSAMVSWCNLTEGHSTEKSTAACCLPVPGQNAESTQQENDQWIVVGKTSGGSNILQCPKCKRIRKGRGKSPFCPDCGASLGHRGICL